ncbi:RagB/SusD family nutrient uptake outer membrane protein [Dysgonomonas sp. ZJ279]|uniref:RagB/SusD family nutrient uptake outer membrane protein n=1 Tax=Dysgonomonas sp. ZJ279 TaxID=2709796 RepID=UPI0013EA8CCB|nr:RagB/SusD family nutrient uptake outer membrane protein [Dysgonomonas sp. ZJ279]
MKKAKLYIISAFVFCTAMFGCSDFLEEEPEKIFTDEQIFTDLNMINSVLANYYGRINWGPSVEDIDGHAYTDEAAFSSGGIRDYRTYDNNWWRLYEYNFVRDINIFLRGLSSETANNNIDLNADIKKQYEGEARFLRAWAYFNMAKGLGGVPIVYDEIYGYESGTNVLDLQVARSTEAATYDYIIAECEAISQLLENAKTNSPSDNIHAARANKWVALALKARAAIYAGSIAKYTTTPELRLPNGEVGIPTSEASTYYQIAYDATTEIIKGGKYSLYLKNEIDLGRNFYDLFINKESNPEVIWALDYVAPGKTHGFTNNNVAYSIKGDVDANKITPILNIVEAFEYKNNRDGKLKIKDAGGDFIFYENLEDLFVNKDARLYGTIITPGSLFRSVYISYQAGQKYLENGEWKSRVGEPGAVNPTYGLLTDQNGPTSGDQLYVSKTGFNIRKFVEENKDAATRGRGSDIWFTRFRFAEILLIAAEASLELGKPQIEVCGYINQVRSRAGIQNLSNVTIDDIIKENRVEFAYENHRYWDLKRWRRAHLLWNNDSESDTSMFYSLFPYKVNEPGNAQNGKWVFEKVKTYTTRYPRYFEMRNYYNFFDQDWLNRNPKLVKNPFQ